MAMLKRIRRVEKKVVVRAHDALRRTAHDAHRDLEQELARVRGPDVGRVLALGTAVMRRASNMLGPRLDEWLHAANPALGGAEPATFLTSGDMSEVQRVDDLLTRIEHGLIE